MGFLCTVKQLIQNEKFSFSIFQSFQQAFAKKPENAIAERNESKSRARSARDFSRGPGDFFKNCIVNGADLGISDIFSVPFSFLSQVFNRAVKNKEFR